MPSFDRALIAACALYGAVLSIDLDAVQRGTAARPAASTSAASMLQAIRRDVLPDVLRITIELDRETVFHEERLDGPPRVFVDFQNTRAVDALKTATIAFPDDVIRQVRVGRQLDSRTRVVLDLQEAGRHSVYTLYNPFRLVIDIERRTPAALTGRNVPGASWTTTSAPPAATSPVAPAAERPVPSTTERPAAQNSERPAAPAAERPATPTATRTPPAPPSTNAAGGFSLSRQLGLGVAKVVIDPGHGGHDPGAQVRGLTEAELVLDIALRLETALQKEPGVEAVLTRRTNSFVALEDRVAIANREQADLYLSIHANASPNATARGVETYFLNFAPNPAAEAIAARENAGSTRTMNSLPEIVRAIALNNKIDESRDFAGMVQTALYQHLRRADRNARNLGVKQAPFMVLIGATMPSALTEISFITNRDEATRLRTPAYRQQIAEALFNGIMKYQQSLKKPAGVATR